MAVKANPFGALRGLDGHAAKQISSKGHPSHPHHIKKGELA